jgi:hypothetical protein
MSGQTGEADPARFEMNEEQDGVVAGDRRPAGVQFGRVAFRSQRGGSLGIRWGQTSGKVSSEDAILGSKILILEQEFLIDQAGNVGQFGWIN